MAEHLPALLEREKVNILSRFPKLNDWLTPEIWWSVVERLRNDRRLARAAEVNPNSVVTALLDLASWGLLPDGKEAFINSYEITQDDGSKLMTAQAQWIWQGGIRRAVDTGVIAHAVADIIRQGDTIEEIVDSKGRHLQHKRDIGKPNRPVIGCYALFWLNNGLMDYELCDIEDIERAKDASKRQSHGNLKDTWKYAMPEMAKKTAIRRGLKRMVGKRDPGYTDMVARETAFDADITEDAGTLSPEETPRAKESESQTLHTSTSATSSRSEASAQALRVVPDVPDPIVEEEVIDDPDDIGGNICAKRSYHLFETSMLSKDPPRCSDCGLVMPPSPSADTDPNRLVTEEEAKLAKKLYEEHPALATDKRNAMRKWGVPLTRYSALTRGQLDAFVRVLEGLK